MYIKYKKYLFFTVDSLCAITIVVRPFITLSSAACTVRSDSESNDEVASSSSKIDGSLFNYFWEHYIYKLYIYHNFFLVISGRAKLCVLIFRIFFFGSIFRTIMRLLNSASDCIICLWSRIQFVHVCVCVRVRVGGVVGCCV